MAQRRPRKRRTWGPPTEWRYANFEESARARGPVLPQGEWVLGGEYRISDAYLEVYVDMAMDGFRLKASWKAISQDNLESFSSLKTGISFEIGGRDDHSQRRYVSASFPDLWAGTMSDNELTFENVKERLTAELKKFVRQERIGLSDRDVEKIMEFVWHTADGILGTVNHYMLPGKPWITWEDWKKKKHTGRVTIIDFLNSQYGGFLEEGIMTQRDLKRLDPKAYRALHNWCQFRGMPASTIVPSSEVDADEVLGRLGREPTHSESVPMPLVPAQS